MDWINTQLCQDLAYGLVYPQIFPLRKRRSDEAHDATLQWGKERAQGWLKVLNDDLLGSANAFLCGATITIADYFAAPFVALGELTGSDFSAYPNVQRWLGHMKSLKQWNPDFEAINGYGATLKGQPMQTV